MTDKEKEKHKNMKKRKAEDAPAPKGSKKDAKDLRTKSQKAINKALGKNY